MKPIEPGDEYVIEYGNGHRLKVKALNGRQKRKIAAVMDRVNRFEPKQHSAEDVYAAAEEALILAVGEQAEELLETTDEQQQLEIAGKVLANAALDEDDKKKSELQPSSDVERFARDAWERAETSKEVPRSPARDAMSRDVRHADSQGTSD